MFLLSHQIIDSFIIKVSKERSVHMEDLKDFPWYCRRNIRKLMRMLSSDAETVYSMMKLTAVLMDLDVDSDMVVSAILLDSGIEDAFEY